ncbi:MAG TPA: hypothetical protein PLG94_13140 [Smithellaceae bacterium]|nr:hypothetical protein [Smithellaceae bacterium]
MQVRELVELGRFFKTFIQEKQLVSQYKQLINAVNQAAQNQNPQEVQKQLQRLRMLHTEAEKRILSPAQSKLMSDYGADRMLGRQARELLDEIFTQHQAHPQGLTDALQSMLNETNTLAKRAEQLISVLEPMLLVLPSGEPGDGEGRLWLYFDNAASVNTIDDLEQAAETWRQILHHFSRMPDATSAPARILQIHKYSPLELEVAASIALLTPLAMGIQWVLARIEHVIKICQEAERLKQLKVKTKIIEDLYLEAKEQRKKITAEAAEEIMTKFGTDNETRNAIEQALNKILSFVEGGGQLDIGLGSAESSAERKEEDDSKGSTHSEIRRLIESIRKDIKLLPANTAAFGEDAESDDTIIST